MAGSQDETPIQNGKIGGNSGTVSAGEIKPKVTFDEQTLQSTPKRLGT